MPETEGNPARPSRFPWAAALLCAASLGAAAWTWMRYSYAWGVRPGDLWVLDRVGSRADSAYAGRYVTLRGLLVRNYGEAVFMECGTGHVVTASLPGGQELAQTADGEASVSGRVSRNDYPKTYYIFPFVDVAASRLHGASITGLIVGAMGVAVFVMCLRTWVKERNALPQA